MNRTVTGRPAITSPNTAQVPRSDSPAKKEIKSLYNPAPGKILMQCDLASAEVRVWGGLSGDKKICELSQQAFVMLGKARNNPDDHRLKKEAELVANFHKQTYALCYGIKPEQVTPSQRQIAKNTTFGITYLMSDQGLASQLGLPVEEAMKIKELYFKVYSGGEKWINDTIEFLHENGYVENPLGRRRRLPEVFSGNKSLISSANRYGVNMPIQATASDYCMMATALLQKEIEKAGVEDDVKLINGVYDSAVAEITATAEWIEWLAKLMRRVFTVDVVKYLKEHFDFESKAPIDIDMEVSQRRQFKCKSCGAKRYPGDGKVCMNDLPTGKKKEDGRDETKPCKCEKYDVIELNGGWGCMSSLEENTRGYHAAAKGF
jgi:DNA polymerase-1